MDDTTLQALRIAFADTGADAPELDASYGASLTSDVARFDDSLRDAAARLEVSGVSPALETMMEPLDRIDREATALAERAESAMESGERMSPAEIVELTMKSQEFMFHSQLTANVANRTADGIQQLFRQQG